MDEEKKSKEIGLYEKLAHRSKELIEGAKEITSGTIDSAIDKAKEEMVAAGDFGDDAAKLVGHRRLPPNGAEIEKYVA